MKFLSLGLSILLFTTGCDLFVSFQDKISQGIQAIDATTGKMTGTALQIKDEIEKLGEELPQKVKDIVQNDLHDLTQSAINSTSNQFKCNIDFVRTRLKDGLINMKRKLTLKLKGHEKDTLSLIPAPPTICDCDPLIIDQDRVVRKITFSGFNIPGKLHMSGVKSDGSIIDMSQSLAYPNEYNITFPVDQNLLNSFERLRLSYPGMLNREILILPKRPVLCKQNTINPLPNPAGLSFTADRKYGPGDADFAGHGPQVTIDGTLKISLDRKSVICRVDFDAQETEDNHSNVGYFKEFPIYTADDDKTISEIISPKEFHISFVDDNHDENLIGPNGFVTSMLVRGDHDGDDIPTYTGATMNFGQLKLIVAECCNGCVSQGELDQIIADNSLKYSDFKKLDSLSKVVLSK